MSRLITVLQAARLVPSARSTKHHVDVNVIRRLIKSGRLSRHYACGQLMVDQDEVQAYIASRRGTQDNRKDRFEVLLVEKTMRELLKVGH